MSAARASLVGGSIDAGAFVGLSYAQVGDCWGLVRGVFRAAGIDLPPVNEALTREAALADEVVGLPRAYDIAVMKGDVDGVGGVEHGGLHVGVCLDGFRVLHATRTGGARIDRLESLRRAGAVLRVARLSLRDMGNGKVERGNEEGEAAGGEAPGRVQVTLFADPIARTGRVGLAVDLLPGRRTAREVAGSVWNGDGGGVPRLLVAVNGRALANGEDLLLRDGDHVVTGPCVGEPSTIILAVIAIAAAAASALLIPKLPPPKGSDAAAEQRYGFNRFSVEAFAGGVIPVVLGHRARYGGNVVAVVPGEGADGSGDNALKMLLCLGHGEIAAFGSLTEDTNRAAGESVTGIYLNDQPIGQFPGCKVSCRMGTAGQKVMTGFDDVEVLREVGVGGVSLRNTDGADRTTSTASGEAYTFTTTLSIDAFVPRIRFARGLYRTTASAQLETQRVQWRHRWRTTDVGSGAGAWSDWAVQTVERAEQAEFFSSPRVGGAGTLNGGTAARMDVQVERVTAESSDLLRVSDMTWDTITEVVDGDNTYAGYAMLALELKASEQLTGVPRISVDTLGAKVRVWDRVSSPDSPTFDTEYSNNPAWLALEVLTNTVWGLGATYPDARVDLASLFAWGAACDESVSRPGGGTRARFTANTVLDDAADGIDVLRTICRAGRAVPVTAGSQWRFALDDVQAAPVERFTQGDIVVDEDGAAKVEYTREYAIGGTVRPNQILAQFENELADGKPDAVVWPEDGDDWLATEEANTVSVRLDAITDPDQAASEVRYQLKKTRFLTRGIAFETSREVVVVQPGDRFDLAVDLPQWGTASGRLMSGSTASSLVLDRDVTLAAATTYYARVLHLDGSVELATVSAPDGTYPLGTPIALLAPLSQAPVAGGLGAEYALGLSEIEMKPFVCTRVRVADAERRTWEISGIEYAEDVYDDAADEVTIPDYSQLSDLVTPPGPVINLRAYEREINGNLEVMLAWGQTPADAALTGSFRVGRRIVGTATWMLVPTASVTNRSARIDVYDTDRGYEFAVVAVSLGGAFLSFDDPRVPHVGMVLGLATPPLPPPDSVTLTGTGGNTYTLSWDAVDEAAEYQVLFGGTSTGLPNDGAEDCLVLARTAATEITGLELPPGESCTFWVRSVGANGRLSWTAASVTEATPGTPAGETIRSTRTFALDSEGTLDNVVWNATPTRLELVNAAADGVYTSPEVDLTTAEVTELTVRPFTENDADDPALYTDPFVVPSIAADQWGVVSVGPKVVGMLMPPWPDASQAWELEVRVHDGAGWGAWETLDWCDSVRETMQKYQVRVSMRRAAAPYRPGLGGLVVVTTAAGGGGGGSTSDGSWDWSNADESGVLWAGTGE